MAKINTVSSNWNLSNYFQMPVHIYTDIHLQEIPSSPSSNLSKGLHFVRIHFCVAHTCRDTGNGRPVDPRWVVTSVCAGVGCRLICSLVNSPKAIDFIWSLQRLTSVCCHFSKIDDRQERGEGREWREQRPGEGALGGPSGGGWGCQGSLLQTLWPMRALAGSSRAPHWQ